MFLLGDDRRLVISASDLRTAAACEFALVRELDVVLGRGERVAVDDDPMAARVIALGNEHEQAELRRLARAHPGRVVQFERPGYSPDDLARAHAQTLDALHSDAEVVYQATFFDGGFVGHADFLERTADGWLVSDTKLARTESVPALLQIAAYAALLREAGVPTAPVARLVVGSGDVRDFALDDIVPVYLARRARLDALLLAHRDSPGPAALGRPPVARLRAVRGLRARGRGRPRPAARGRRPRSDPPQADRRRGHDHRRARRAHRAGRPTCARPPSTGCASRPGSSWSRSATPTVAFAPRSTDPDTLRRMPRPSPGDVFFDFEGDPLWSERGSRTWGLEYLFGIVEVDTGAPVFRTFWAHDRDAERQALIDFVGWLDARRRQWPDLHVYHYAPYETAALLRLAARHGVCEDEVDQLLRDGVFVDLYAVVRSAIRVSQRSYSIKKLEPLYMEAREAAVTNAADSIVVYHQFMAARDAERHDEAAGLIAEIADYNRDDCVSTWLLRDWLLAQGAASSVAGPVDGPVVGVEPAVAQTPSEQRLALIRLETLLRDRLVGIKPHERSAEQQAVALVASSVLFHAREDKPVWQAHFERLRMPVGDWRVGRRRVPRRVGRGRRAVAPVHAPPAAPTHAAPGGRADARHPGRPRRRGQRRLRRPTAARRHHPARPRQRSLHRHRRDRRGRRPARRERPAAPEPARRGAPAQGRRRPLAPAGGPRSRRRC